MTPERTAAGYRLYDVATINRILAMRQLVEEGWAPSAAAARVRDTPVEDVAEAAPAAPVATAVHPDPLVDRFVTAAAALDTAALTSVLDELTAELLRADGRAPPLPRPASPRSRLGFRSDLGGR